MKNLTLILIVISFYSNAQSIDVIVDNTGTEISGSTYDVNSSNAQDVDLILTVKNNTGTDQNWDLERIRPSVQNWNDWSMSWSVWSNISTANDFIIYPDSIWITPIDIPVPQGDSMYLALRYELLTDGCDFYTYYILNNNARVDSFNVNICKTVGLDEITNGNVSIYPNPANTDLNISFENQSPKELTIVDLLGSEIAIFNASESMKISTDQFSDGIYFLSWKIEGVHFKRKFQVQH